VKKVDKYNVRYGDRSKEIWKERKIRKKYWKMRYEGGTKKERKIYVERKEEKREELCLHIT
jgi:hypothetical protein